jgi:hypothetical protein
MLFIKDHHINITLIVFAALVVLGVLWRILTPSVEKTERPISTSMNATYTDPTYGFSMDYDIHLKQSNPSDDAALPWRYNTETVGTRVVTLRLPKDFQPHTNFGEGVVSVGVSADPVAVKECMVPTNGEVLAPEQNKAFTVFISSDAGAGNFYEVTSYRTIYEGRCIALERLIHSTNIGNYDEDRNIKEFDRASVVEILDRAIQSFRFE